MNKIALSVIRTIILLTVFGFAVIFFFGEEEVGHAFQTIVDKALAVVAFWYGCKLYKHWSRVEPWLIAYGKMCDEVKDSNQKTAEE